MIQYIAMVAKKKSKARIIVPIAVVAALVVVWQVVANLTGFLSGQWFSDRITVAVYQPSALVADLADGSGMNDDGKFYFYTGVPQIDDRDDFNVDCADAMNEESIVLGCYDGNIYLFDVTDERISGVKYVTAAHEMLHAAYDRLGPIEKNRVDNLLADQLDATTDQRILDLVEIYDTTEPGYRLNELHSIFGTEVRDLSPELSTYYVRYFDDRDRVVAASEKYEAVFEQMERQANDLDAQMASLEAEITSLSDGYDARVAQLSRDIDSFNARASTYGGFASESVFYAQRNALIARQNQLNAEADTINAKIDTYNQCVADLQALGREAEKLQHSIDSRSLLE
ncbi:hypothetical protein FACS189431_2850 [Alphaproteobacteria bacterium]|nr:hypothetical protein FACS189431_2850 [Alphaproteobacteria bacterium]